MSKFISIVLYSLSVSLFMKSVAAEGDCQSIAAIACGTEGFSTLCTAVQAAGLDGVLDKDTFTVFAPTDDAFGNLPEGTIEALLDDIPSLTDILLFHTVEDHEIFAKDLHCTELLEMTNGVDSRTVCSGGSIFQKGAGNPRSAMPEIVSTDIEACNGVVHVVSEVMLPTAPAMMPPDEGDDDDDDDDDNDCMNIAEIACGTEGFETLCTAVQAAGLAETLATVDHATVFAPTDDAFGNLPEGTVPALLDDIPALTNILLFHVVLDKVVESGDLKCSKLIHMANGKDSRTICRGSKIFQKGAGNPDDARPEIVSADIHACNGVIHVVNEVMLPP